MAGRRRLGLSGVRMEGRDFIGDRSAWRQLLRRQVEGSRGVGRSMVGVRWKGAATCGRRRPMVAWGRRGVATTPAPRGSVGDPQTSRIGTKEHGAQTAGRRPASACAYIGGAKVAGREVARSRVQAHFGAKTVSG
jgi:hypothetical protein